jgi:D-alanyl-D-alanine carboxypeptidase
VRPEPPAEPHPAGEPAPVPPTAEAANPIQIARVRPVMVAPRVRPVAPPAESALAVPVPMPEPASNTALTAYAGSAAPLLARAAKEPETPRLAPVATPPAPALPAPVVPEAAQAPARTVSVRLPAAQPVRDPPAPARVPPRVPVVAAQAPAGVALGSAPSTLQAQAEALARGAPPVAPVRMASLAPPPPTFRLQGPAPTRAQPAGGFAIQIGAYNTEAEAERALADAQARGGSLLASAQPLSVPVQKDARSFHRARFAGFDARSAAATCLALRRLSVDCFVMKSE